MLLKMMTQVGKWRIAVTLTACLDPGIGPGGSFNPVGTWRLTTQSDNNITITLHANGTATMVSTWSDDFLEQRNGTYIVSGNTIMVTWFATDFQHQTTYQFILVDNNTLIHSEGYVFTRTR